MKDERREWRAQSSTPGRGGPSQHPHRNVTYPIASTTFALDAAEEAIRRLEHVEQQLILVAVGDPLSMQVAGDLARLVRRAVTQFCCALSGRDRDLSEFDDFGGAA